MSNEKQTSVKDIVETYKKTISQGGGNQPKQHQEKPKNEETNIPNIGVDESVYKHQAMQETDPDLIVGYETVKLPSRGLFYKNGLSEVDVEYMTSKDEDLLTTPSLIQSGQALPKLLKRKIKTSGVEVEKLLPGDKSALILFLRTSSYGPEYTVEVQDPRTGEYFKETVDLFKLKPKEIKEHPDENLEFSFELPMRKKLVKFRILTSGEEEAIRKNADSIMQQYGEEYAQYSTLKMKSAITSIDGNGDRNYINKFVDAIPAYDSTKLKKKYNDVSPEFDMGYEFTAKDGYKFTAYLMVGSDFFFPND